jgi:hypothetical protein
VNEFVGDIGVHRLSSNTGLSSNLNCQAPLNLIIQEGSCAVVAAVSGKPVHFITSVYVVFAQNSLS